MEYIVKKTKKRKKTIGVSIINNKIIIYAPIDTKKEIFDKIYNKYKDKLQMNNININKNYILYLGKKYEIKKIKSNLLKMSYCEILDNDFIIYIPEKQFNDENSIELAINNWKKQEAQKIFSERIKFYLNKYNFNFDFNKNKIFYKNQKSKWGSCSYINNLNFNYNAISKNIEVIDYLIVHELTHTLIKNHSKNFWLFIENILPNYKTLRQQLKNN